MLAKNIGSLLTNLKIRKDLTIQLYQGFSSSQIRPNGATTTPIALHNENHKVPKPLSWNLFGSVCIERMPIITCDMNDLENRYSNLINQLNVRKSLLSDHELRHLKDLEIAGKRKQQSGVDQNNREVVIETAVDYEDQCLKQLQSFNFAERKTSASESGETNLKKPAGVLKNLDRILDKKLVLLVFNQERSQWELPEMQWVQDDKSLRSTAEKAVEKLNSYKEGLKVTFLGNAPAGVYKTKPNKEVGEKHYIFKAQYKSGGELLALAEFDYAWIRKEELPDFIKNPEYLECLNNLILDF